MVKIVELIRSPFEEIPSPIIGDILSRLPTKACLNSKVVCKDWYDIITSCEFSNLRRSSGCYSTLLLYGRFYGSMKFVLLDLDKHTKVDETGKLIEDDDAMVRFNPRYMKSNKELRTINECNGLILLRSTKDRDPYVVCNLVTGQHVVVKLDQITCSNYAETEGLGCCPVSHQFKVLRISKCTQSNSFLVEIQTLGTNKWRIISDNAPIEETWGKVVFINGSLHKYNKKEHCISSFHFGNETLFRIPLPEKAVTVNYCSISIYDSCLCFASYFGDNYTRFGFWVMKDYGVKESWVKLYVNEIYHYSFGGLHLPLLQVGSKEILIAYRSTGLGLNNIRDGRCRNIEVLGDINFHVFSFSPNFSNNALGSDASMVRPFGFIIL